jgi:hypothetical protein
MGFKGSSYILVNHLGKITCHKGQQFLLSRNFHMHKDCGFENLAKFSSFCKKLIKFALEKQKNQKHLSLGGKKFPNKTLSPITHKRI